MTLLPCRPGENRAHIFFVGTVCATVHFAARAAYFTAGVYTKRQSKSEADAKWYVKCTFESAIVLVGFGHISRPLRGSMAWPGRKGRRAGLCDIMPPGRYFLPLPSGSVSTEGNRLFLPTYGRLHAGRSRLSRLGWTRTWAFDAVRPCWTFAGFRSEQPLVRSGRSRATLGRAPSRTRSRVGARPAPVLVCNHRIACQSQMSPSGQPAQFVSLSSKEPCEIINSL
jgi:hypothetical protein